MQQLFIPKERVRLLKKEKQRIAALAKVCDCKITIDADDAISIENNDQNGYFEFLARNVLFAFGRGFDLAVAEKLTHDDYYFATIDLGQELEGKRLLQIKSRIIGEEGKTKNYIESVSGAKLAIYGDTVSFIGSYAQLEEAQTAVSALIEGSTHKAAYARMEAAHRKNKTQRHDAAF